MTTTTTTTTTTVQGDAIAAAPLAVLQAVTLTVNPSSGTNVVAALSKSVGSPVVLTAATTYKLRGVRLTAARFRVAFKTHHRVKITGTRKNGKLVATSVTLLV